MLATGLGAPTRVLTSISQRWTSRASLPKGIRAIHGKDLPISFGDISKAMFRIRGGVPKTPAFESRRLSKILGCNVVLKAEHQLPTGRYGTLEVYYGG